MQKQYTVRMTGNALNWLSSADGVQIKAADSTVSTVFSKKLCIPSYCKLDD